MKKNIFPILLLLIAGILQAQQSYKQAIGVRLSTHTEYDVFAASYKFFVTQPGAIELNLGFGTKRYYTPGEGRDKNAPSISFAGTYQHHFDIKPVAGLRWFAGGGLVLFNTNSKNDDYDGLGAGIYPTGGIDYKFIKIPLNLTADFRPTFHIAKPNGYNSFHAHDVGLAARFTF